MCVTAILYFNKCDNIVHVCIVSVASLLHLSYLEFRNNTQNICEYSTNIFSQITDDSK